MSSRLRVGPFLVDDLGRWDVVQAAADLALAGGSTPKRAYALHVGGLNSRDDTEFVEEMRTADLVYADGGSVLLLGKLAGAQHLERASTTDIGWDVLHELARRLGGPPRVALVGGVPGLAERAGEALAALGAAEVVFTAHGYHQTWEPVLEGLAESAPQVVVVGMGAPREMLWVRTWFHRLPPALVLTCGGWFGFLTGEEKRAVGLLCKPGLEWIARVAQSPGRLAPRYAHGMVSTGVLFTALLATRLHLTALAEASAALAEAGSALAEAGSALAEAGSGLAAMAPDPGLAVAALEVLPELGQAAG